MSVNVHLAGLVKRIHEAAEAGQEPALARWRGKDVAAFRKDVDLSQASLAKLCGITRQTVALWEAEPEKHIPRLASRWLALIDAVL